MMPLELFADGGPTSAQLLHHALQPALVVSPHALTHGWRSLVTRGVEPGQPLFVLSALLQQLFDCCFCFRGCSSHGKMFLSSALWLPAVPGEEGGYRVPRPSTPRFGK